MKVYRIPDPETLKHIVVAVKDPEDAEKVQARAVAWSSFARRGNPDAMVIYLELGRAARLYLVKNGEKKILGAVNLNAARDLAKGLVGINESS